MNDPGLPTLARKTTSSQTQMQQLGAIVNKEIIQSSAKPEHSQLFGPEFAFAFA